MALSLHEIFSGIPLVESPLFCDMIDELTLNEHERHIAIDLNERGFVEVTTKQSKPNLYLGEPIEAEPDRQPHPTLLEKITRRMSARTRLPEDFDPNAYHRLNPCVGAARLDAATHYLCHGKSEGQRYQFR